MLRLKSAFFLILFIFLITPVFSQFEIGPPVYPIMPNLGHMSVVDADGDGDNELLTSALIDSRIGTFDVDQNWTRTFNILSSSLISGNDEFMSSDQIYPADLDNDGDIDLLSLEYSLNRQIIWYERTSEDMIRHVIDEVDAGFSITHYDHDQDGDQDILYSTTNSEIVLYEQTSAGVFADPVAVFSTGSVSEFLWNDLDQDGDLDLLSCGTHLAFFENIENVLQAPMDLSTPGNSLKELEVVDFNNDGLLDLVALDSAAVALRVYYQSEGLDFSTTMTVPTFTALLSWELFDVNVDGIDDLVIAIENFGDDSSLYYYAVDDQGQLGTFLPLLPFGQFSERCLLISGDINNDGLEELIARERDLIDVFQGSVNGLTHMAEINGKPSSQKVWTADLNGDGLEDLLLDGSNWTSPEHIAFNDGNGAFLLGDPLTGYGIDLQVYSPNIHDFNNDGLTDVFLYSAWPGTGTILEQTSEGTLVPLSYFSSGSDFIYVHSQFGDLNGDGLDDIILSEEIGSSPVEIWMNIEAGDINDTAIEYDISVDGAVREHLFDDTNGDNFADLFIIATDGIYLSLGNGITWDAPVLVSDQIGSSPLRGSLLDIEADGDIDLLVFTSSSCFLLTNDQSDNWPVSIVDLDSSDGYENFVVSDFDNNGLPDLAHVEATNYKAEIRLNNGEGGFAAADLVSFVLPPSNIVAIDLDGDGDKDLCVENGGCQRWVINTATAGCTDDQALNFNDLADFDNGTCIYDSCGCMDPLADNFDSEANCNDGSCMYTITISVFDDLNQDGEMNEQDNPLGDFFVSVDPIGSTYMTDFNGEFFLEVEEGTTLELSPNTTNIFPDHTTVNPLEINIPDDYSVENYRLGVAKIEPTPQIDLDLFSPGLTGLCEFPESFVIVVDNPGNLALSGEVQVQYSGLLTPAFIFFDHTVVNDSAFTFEFDNLSPGAQLYRQFYLTAPGADHIGEYFQVQTNVLGQTPDYTEVEENDFFEFELLCAYDPNDKRVSPEGYEEPHFIAVDQELEYTVRFQNTGNSPAINVVVEDTISEYLDLSTLDIKGASHNMQVEINESERLIRFVFPEIMLPDSTCCLEESQGFVAFAMAPLAGLADGTEINNDAYIYFDNNEAIITNETWSTIMVCSDEMSAIDSDYDLQICEDTEFEFSNDSPWIEEYLWQFGGELVSSDSIAVLLTEEPGDEVLVLTTSNPVCESTTELDFEVVENDIDGQGFYINDQENLLSLDGFETYQWLLNGDPIDGATNPTYLAPFSGDYGLYVTNSFGCGEFAEEIFAGPVSISELDLELVEVFPNPVSDVLSIDFPYDTETSYQLLDSKGSLITSGNLSKGMNAIDMSALASGLYFLKVDGAAEVIKVSKN